MDADITIRTAAAGDESGWVDCVAGLFAEDSGTRDATMNQDWPRSHSPASFRAGLADDSRLLLVAVDGDEVVACLSAWLGEPSAVRPVRVATLQSMFVVSRVRGAGVGARLVAEFRAWARACGAARVAVTAYAANEGAVRFYRRQGLVPFHVTLEADA